MKDHLLVEALRARDPGALGAVYDGYGTPLYAYCWSLSRSRDAAEVALRDTFIVAEAHIEKLREPERFAAWLYAVARQECARRPATPGRAPDVPIASHDQLDVDQRIMAWRAVQALSPSARELLDLRIRHAFGYADLAEILNIPVKAVPELLDQAKTELDAALAAELLAHEGPYDCQGRADLLRERRGELTAELRGLLLRHARECPVCGALQPRAASAAKVFRLLPEVAPPDALRLRILSCFTDPELVSYRLFVATRGTDWNHQGFPAPPRRPLPTRSASGRAEERARRLTRTMAMAAVAILGLGALLGYLISGTPRDARWSASGVHPERPAVPAPVGTGTPTPSGPAPSATAVPGDASPVSATFPLGARGSSAPPSALPSPPARLHQSAPDGPPAAGPAHGTGTLAVSPLFLDVGTGSTGNISIQAVGGPLTWSAAARGPVRISPASGTLAPGGSATLTVQVFRAAGGHGQSTITLQPGGASVTVTWRRQPPPPPHSPPPPTTPAPSPTRSDTPTPSGLSSDSPSGSPSTSADPTPTDDKTSTPASPSST